MRFIVFPSSGETRLCFGRIKQSMRLVLAEKPGIAASVPVVGSGPAKGSYPMRPGKRSTSRSQEKRSVRDTVAVQPGTRYARSGDVSIAFQASGDGPFDVVFVPPATSHVELSGRSRCSGRCSSGLGLSHGSSISTSAALACPTG